MSPAARVSLSPLCSLGLSALAAAPRTRTSDPHAFVALDTHDTHTTQTQTACEREYFLYGFKSKKGGPVESLAPTRSTARGAGGGGVRDHCDKHRGHLLPSSHLPLSPVAAPREIGPLLPGGGRQSKDTPPPRGVNFFFVFFAIVVSLGGSDPPP